ncbi:uncharacterized protein LOC142224549 [Haematobia irritans]|uniref:uncharacterized protein LOC142224549 n=1 Tax=Haematobia irritans TaxID=7368 RepID=UPI003F4F9CF0
MTRRMSPTSERRMSPTLLRLQTELAREFSGSYEEDLCGLIRMSEACWGAVGNETVPFQLAVIRPVAVYGYHVWWPITNHHNHILRLGRINRTALIYMTGAMRTTATAALEVLMGICPLDLHIRRTAEVILIRLRDLDSLESTGCRHTELIVYAGRHMRTDYMATRHMYENNLDSIIPSIGNWDENRIHFVNLNIYTDYSKIYLKEGTGSGIYCKELELKGSFKCDVSIFIDSHAAIKALGNKDIRLKVVSRCRRELTVLTEQRNVTLYWVPRHYGITGNEEADVTFWLMKAQD